MLKENVLAMSYKASGIAHGSDSLVTNAIHLLIFKKFKILFSTLDLKTLLFTHINCFQ